MKIMLAADGSAFTHIAARHLASHLQWFASPPEVHVVYVHPNMPYPGAAGATGKDAVAKYQREEAETALAVAEKELIAAGIAYVCAWKVGDVTEQLGEYVKDHDIDLVVMGSHGHGALANLAIGSIATKCIAALEAPIMIVRTSQVPKPLTRREKTYGPAPRAAHSP